MFYSWNRDLKLANLTPFCFRYQWALRPNSSISVPSDQTTYKCFCTCTFCFLRCLYRVLSLQECLRCCSEFDLYLYGMHVICTNVLVTFLSDMMLAWSHGVYSCIILFVQMNALPLTIWKLFSILNIEDLWSSTSFFSKILADKLLIFPLRPFKPKKHPHVLYNPPVDLSDVDEPIRSF